MKSLIIATVLALFSGSSFGGDTTVRDFPGSELRVYMMHKPSGLAFVPLHKGGFHHGRAFAYRPMHRPAYRLHPAAGLAPVRISVPSFEVADVEMELVESVSISVPSFEIADAEMELVDDVTISVPTFEVADEEMALVEAVRISIPSFEVADEEMELLEAVKISVPGFQLADSEMNLLAVEPIGLPSFERADEEIVALMNGSAK